MPRRNDLYSLYGHQRMLIDQPKKLTPEEQAKLAKKMKKRKEKEVLEDRACIRRLMADLKELTMCAGEFPNVSACPLEENIFLWHANVTASDGPMKGLCIHLELQFPSSYPRNPPKVRVLTKIRHPNVFGDWICLSMLRKRKYTEDVPHEAWSSGYSVASILLQLQSFLFSENVPQDSGYSQQNGIEFSNLEKIRKFSCSRCSHTGDNPCPPLKIIQFHNFQSDEERLGHEFERWQSVKKDVYHHKMKRKEAKEAFIAKGLVQISLEKQGAKKPYFPGKKFAHVLSEYLDPYEILLISLLYPAWTVMKDKYTLQEKYESTCFYTKLTFEEAALGVGVKIQRDLYKPKEIRQLSSDLDLISWHAWNKLKCRLSAWGNDCDLFVPMVLNHSHMRNAGKLMWRQLRKLAVVEEFDADHDARILDAICALMNSMVVGFNQTEGEVRMYHSEKALQGFCRFHQLLLQVCSDRPNIRTLAEEAVEKFIKNPRSRHKKGTPDLGRLLVMLSVSEKFGWDDIKGPFFEEVIVRNAKWYIMDNPTLRFDVDTRDYGSWFRGMKPNSLRTQPREDADFVMRFKGDVKAIQREGTLFYGREIFDDWIKVDTPVRGFIKNSNYGDEEKPKFPLQKLPFQYPALCKTKRRAAGRMKRAKDSIFIRNIEANEYVVILDIVGNRAHVASVQPDKPQTTKDNRKQILFRTRKTIYGNIIIDEDLDRLFGEGDSKSTAPIQDAVWISLETAKGPLLENVDINDNWRLDTTFDCIEISRNLVMFQKAFLDVIKEGKTLDELNDIYLGRWGNPPPGSLGKLHAHVKKIKKMKTWNQYLSYLKLPALSKADMIELLKRSVTSSERKRYTRSFHTGFDEIPNIHKHRPKNRQVSKSFVDDELPEDYVSRYARPARKKRQADRDSDSGSSVATDFVPQGRSVVQYKTVRGVQTTFNAVVYSMFLGGISKEFGASSVHEFLSRQVPSVHRVYVPRDENGNCRGFAFIDVPSLENATALMKTGIQTADQKVIYPRFSRPKQNRIKHH